MGLLDKLDIAQWHIGLMRRPVATLIDGYCDLEIQWLRISPEPEYAADPFGLTRDNRLHVFFEFKPFGPRDGFIAYVEVGPDNTTSAVRPVLRLPHHVSYPFLLECRGQLFMVPETAEAGEIMLFRCARFPDQWEKEATMIPAIEAVDNTILHHGGLWWLFSACAAERDELFLWFAPELLGPWQAHPRNPVKTGLGATRPAGTLFSTGGEVFRPAQDNSNGLGRRIVLNRISALSTTEYDESPVAYLEPDDASHCPAGRHTLAAAGDVTLVDGLRKSRTLSPKKLMGKVEAKYASVRGQRSRRWAT